MSLLKELVKNIHEADEFAFGGGEMSADQPTTVSGGEDEFGEPGPTNDEDSDMDSNPEDAVSMDVPLLIRIMEWAHEDAQSDVELHKVTENLVAMAADGRTLTMEDYDAAVEGVGQPDQDDMGGDDEADSGYGDNGSMPDTGQVDNSGTGL